MSKKILALIFAALTVTVAVPVSAATIFTMQTQIVLHGTIVSVAKGSILVRSVVKVQPLMTVTVASSTVLTGPGDAKIPFNSLKGGDNVTVVTLNGVVQSVYDSGPRHHSDFPTIQPLLFR